MRLHKTILLFAMLGIISSASAQDVSSNVNTCFVDRVTGKYDSFKWKWAGYNTQSNTLYLFNGSTSTPYIVTGKNVGFRMSTETDSGQTDYINTTNVTISVAVGRQIAGQYRHSLLPGERIRVVRFVVQ